jgi:hypothetical protein
MSDIQTEQEKWPEIAALLAKYDGRPGRAERAAGISLGTFSKVRRGAEKYTPHMQAKVQAALERPTEPPKQKPIKEVKPKMAKPAKAKNPIPRRRAMTETPSECPPLLAEAIRKIGNKEATMRELHVSKGIFYDIMTGKREMPPAWIIKLKATLGQSVIGTQINSTEPPPLVIPPFKPWDGKKKVNIKVRIYGGGSKVMKGVPEPLAKLVEKFDGNRSAASHAMGRSGNYITTFMVDPKKFIERAQLAVHAAMHGAPPLVRNSLSEDFDKYTLGLAIVLIGPTGFDRINDLAEILNGRLVFRKNTKSGWLVIYKFATEDLPKFKKLAMRDANEIVCP